MVIQQITFKIHLIYSYRRYYKTTLKEYIQSEILKTAILHS